MQDTDEALAEASELGFCSATTGIKSVFFRFMDISLVEMIHQRALNYSLTISFD